MKRVLLIICVLLLISCNKSNQDIIIGKWQTTKIIYSSNIDKDSLDMKDANEFFTFRDDSSMYITNGEKETNAKYYIRDNVLYTFNLGSLDTNKMDIIFLDNKNLSLMKILKEFEDTRMYINLKRLEK